MVSIEQLLQHYNLDSYSKILWQNGYDDISSFCDVSFSNLVEIGIPEEDATRLVRLASDIAKNSREVFQDIEEDNEYYKIVLYDFKLAKSRDSTSYELQSQKGQYPWRRYHSAKASIPSGVYFPDVCPVCLRNTPDSHVFRTVTWGETRKDRELIYKVRTSSYVKLKFIIPCCSNHKKTLPRILSFHLGNPDALTVYIRGSRYTKLFSTRNRNAFFVKTTAQEKNQPRFAIIASNCITFLLLVGIGLIIWSIVKH